MWHPGQLSSRQSHMSTPLLRSTPLSSYRPSFFDAARMLRASLRFSRCDVTGSKSARNLEFSSNSRFRWLRFERPFLVPFVSLPSLLFSLPLSLRFTMLLLRAVFGTVSGCASPAVDDTVLLLLALFCAHSSSVSVKSDRSTLSLSSEESEMLSISSIAARLVLRSRSSEKRCARHFVYNLKEHSILIEQDSIASPNAG
uniref:Uncharacterized protein n=1 Tax=Anopheles coluzzii TaxID=1518534 RepID=A0A8W7PHF0_ANOCL